METVAISQMFSHVYGTGILDVFIKYRIRRYICQHLEYKYYITVTKAGV